MAPKKDSKANKGEQKALEKQKQKVVEDKTFGLKNKNKSKAVQKYIKGVQQQVKGPQKGGDTAEVALKKQQMEEKKKISQQEALLASLFKGTENIKKVVVDEKKTFYDPKQSKEEQKIDLYTDMRDQKGVEWDPSTVIETDIVCKFFQEAVESGRIGWFWNCPNDGDKCKYNHKLPEGYVLKRDENNDDSEEEEEPLEEKLERERALLGTDLTPVTKETFEAWKKKKEAERLAAVEAARQAEAKKTGGKGLHILSGRDLFQYDPTLFEDDEGAADEEDYEEDENYWNTVINENQKTLDQANEGKDNEDQEKEKKKDDDKREDDSSSPIKEDLFLDEIPDDLDDIEEDE